MEKLNDYYQKTAASNAHIIAMGILDHMFLESTVWSWSLVLDPAKKFNYFKKHSSELLDDVIEPVQKKVCIVLIDVHQLTKSQFIEYYYHYHRKQGNVLPSSSLSLQAKKSTNACCRHSVESNPEKASDGDRPLDSLKPWLRESLFPDPWNCSQGDGNGRIVGGMLSLIWILKTMWQNPLTKCPLLSNANQENSTFLKWLKVT